VTNVTVTNGSAAPNDPVVGALDTDIHLYIPDGMACIAPYIRPMDDPSPEDMSKMVSLVGAECLMFSTDYPHWDTDTPGRVFESECIATKHQIYRTNAQEIFR
jgi:hypothetical protein